MKAKDYKGYRSFSYLEPGVDYRAFPLAEEIDRVPSRPVPTTPEQEERVRRLLAETTTVSLHEHTFVVPEDPSQIFEARRHIRDATGYEGLAQAGLDAVFDNLQDGTSLITSRAGWKWDDIIYDLGMRLSDIAHQEFVIRGETVADIERARAEGKVAFFPALEAATPIQNELDRLDILYGLGVRMMGVVYSESNTLGSGLREPRDGGLTVFGRQAVQRMNKLGVAVDVSHASDLTCLDTFEASDKPVFITHCGARALWPSKRMKPDEVLRACAQGGGVVGIEAAPHTTLTEKVRRHSIDAFMEHFEYCANLVGIDHVSFGPDTMYGDHVALHHAFAGQLSIRSAHEGLEYEPVPYVDGIENPTEAFPNITRWLVTHGYSDADIKKVLGENTLRVLRQIFPR